MLLAVLVSAAGTGGTLPYLWSFLQHSRALGAGGAGILFTVRAASALAGALFAGAWVDRLGAKRVVAGAALAASGITLTLLVVHDMLSGVLVLVLYGLVGAVLGTALNAQLASLVSPEKRKRAIALACAFTAGGGSVGAVVAAMIMRTWAQSGFAAVFIIDAASFAILALVLALGLPTAMPVPRSDRKASTQSEAKYGYLVAARDRSLRRVCLLVAVIVGAGFCQVTTGLPAYQAAASTGTRGLGWVYAANVATLVLLQMPAQRLSVHWRPARALAAGLALLAGAWATLMVAPDHGLATLTAAAVLLAGGEVMLTPVLAAEVNNIAPKGMVGRYNGALTLAWTGGWLIGTSTTALIAATGRTQLLPILLLLPLTVAAVAVLVSSRQRGGRTNVLDPARPNAGLRACASAGRDPATMAPGTASQMAPPTTGTPAWTTPDSSIAGQEAQT